MAVPTSISEKYSKTGTEVDAARFLIELSGKQFSAREKSGQPVEPFCVQQERDLGGLEEGDRAGLQIKREEASWERGAASVASHSASQGYPQPHTALNRPHLVADVVHLHGLTIPNITLLC